MRLDELKTSYINDYSKYIKSEGNSFDVNDFDNLIRELKGERTFNLFGSEYQFIKDFELLPDEPTIDYSLTDDDIDEILVGIYENLSGELQKNYLEEMLNHTKDIPYKTSEYFEKLKNEIQQEIEINNTDNDTENNDLEEENDMDFDTYDNEEELDSVEEENKTEEEEKIEEATELDLNVDGPEITKYKNETEELKEKLAELEKNLEELHPKEETEFGEIIENLIDEVNSNNKKNDELQEKLINAENNLQYYERQRQNYSNEYNLNDEQKKQLLDKDGLETAKVIKAMDLKIEEQKSIVENLKKEVADSIINNEQIKYHNVDVWKLRNFYEKEIQKLKDTLEAISNKGNEYYKENKGIPYEFHRMTDDLNKMVLDMETTLNEKCGIRSWINIKDSENKVLIEKIKESRELNNNTKQEIKENFNIEVEEKNSDLENQINDLKNDIEKREQNIKTYYECLELIKSLNKDLDNGLDMESEEFISKVENIDKSKISLPENLKNELDNYLRKVIDNHRIKKQEPIPVENVEKNPKLTWKTFTWLAAGLGLGAVVGFTVGPVGLVVGNFAIAGAKIYVNKLRKKVREKRLNGENEIVAIEQPDNKLKATMQKFKNYIKSEEGLRDISWGLTGGVIGLNLGHLGKNIMDAQQVANTTVQEAPTPTAEPTPDLTSETVTSSNQYSDIKIGENVGEFNVEVGHDSANWAVNGTNAENLIGEYVNGDSVFQRFAVMNPDGSINQIINSNGVSINDLINSGIDPSTIAVDVGKNGISQAWVNISELTKDISSIGRGLH